MRGIRFLTASIIAAIALAGSASAATFWLSTDMAGTPIAGGAVTVAPGESVTLYCFLEGSESGNTFEMMVGYDTSDAATYGAGKDTNDGDSKNLTLASTKNQIVAGINSFFDVFTTAGYAGSQVVLDASGREAVNAALGGRPYGFLVRAAKSSNTAPGAKLLFSFALTNNMTTQGESQYVVLSNNFGGKSYSSAWKNGMSIYQDSYVLNVVTGTGVTKPLVGASNKAILDAIMTDAAADYTWVLWGIVSGRNSNGFVIDDGSGVMITVNAPGNTVEDGDYVSVKGSIDPVAHTITSQQTTKHNP